MGRLVNLLHLRRAPLPTEGRAYIQAQLRTMRAKQYYVYFNDILERHKDTSGLFRGASYDAEFGIYLPPTMEVYHFLGEGRKAINVRATMKHMLGLEFDVPSPPIFSLLTHPQAMQIETEQILYHFFSDLLEQSSFLSSEAVQEMRLLFAQKNWNALAAKLVRTNAISQAERLAFFNELLIFAHEGNHYDHYVHDLQPYLRKILTELHVGELEIKQLEFSVATMRGGWGGYHQKAEVIASIVKAKTGRVLDIDELSSNLALAWEKSAIQTHKELGFHLAPHPFFSDFLEVSGNEVRLRASMRRGQPVLFRPDDQIDDFIRATYAAHHISPSLPYLGVTNVHRLASLTEEIIRHANH
ncbi:MAG: hypothetical protein HYY62_02555 [Deltaproteobacteria bacterium]|nr:hypothetical protein [Deltaproteobacteria bacterium]